MSFFMKKDKYGDDTLRIFPLVAGGAGALVALTLAFSSFYINEEREVSLEVMFGKVSDVENTAGLKMKNPLASRFAYSLARQSTPVSEATNLRTGDDLRLSGRYYVDYEIDQDADVNKLYFDLQDQGGDLENVLSVRAKDAAVRAIESLTIEDLMPEEDPNNPDAEIESFTDMITSGVQDRLQSSLNAEGWPVRIIGVYSDGFNFSNDSEDRIAEIVGIRAERVKLGLRQENAEKAAEVYATEAAADAAYINALRETAGLTDADVGYALCLKMNRDANRVNEPLAAGCNAGGGSNVGVVVDPSAAARRPAPTPN